MKTAVYRHYDEAGRLLYIGMTANPYQRSTEHARLNTDFCGVARIEIEWHKSRHKAAEAERRAIKAEAPKYNVLHNSKAPPAPPNTIADRIASSREKAGLSKADLARIVDVSAPTVTDWESGAISKISSENLFRLADALDVSGRWLVFGNSQVVTSFSGHKALRRAFRAIGSQAALAEICGVTAQAITKWVRSGKAPAKHCIPIEIATGGAVTRYELRPDVFGTPTAEAAAA